MDFDLESTLGTFTLMHGNMEVKFTAYPNAVEEASVKFFAVEHHHLPGRPTLHLPQSPNIISFRYPPRVFLVRVHLEHAIISMLSRPLYFEDPVTFDVVRPQLSDFCVRTIQGCNGRGVRFQVRADLHYDDEDEEEDEEEMPIAQGFGGVAASDSAIAKLERLKDFGAGSNFEQDDCSICFEMFEKTEDMGLARMPCSHVFHYQCIVQWLERSRVCPLCRYEMCY